MDLKFKMKIIPLQQSSFDYLSKMPLPFYVAIGCSNSHAGIIENIETFRQFLQCIQNLQKAMKEDVWGPKDNTE